MDILVPVWAFLRPLKPTVLRGRYTLNLSKFSSPVNALWKFGERGTSPGVVLVTGQRSVANNPCTASQILCRECKVD
ncbi:hypothetical protein TNCV_2638591 [Trichonephila clavipes]|nr:hypothetical protein TNCV_2638591 [Trichonephila clavipes]